MDIVDFTKRFQALETEHLFFSKKTNDNIHFWDIARYDVFVNITKALRNDTGNIPTSSARDGWWRTIKRPLTFAFQQARLFSYILFNKPSYIGFICSRYREQGRYIDTASFDVTTALKGKMLLLETYLPYNAKLDKGTFHDPGPFFRKLYRIFKSATLPADIHIYKPVAEALEKEFRVRIDITGIIARLITDYKADMWYYSILYKKTRPSAIFIVQNGVRKALYEAAKKAGIPTIELQHGLIGYTHPAYSYPASPVNRQFIILPNYFFAFSDFWVKKINFPVDKIIPLGNNFYAKKIKKISPVYSLTVIFANIYTADLMNLVDGLLLNGYKKNIAIKLHPNQVGEYEYLARRYRAYQNVSVLPPDTNLADVIRITEAILAIQSTAAYEALANGLKVLLYAIKDYGAHEDIFDNSNVYLVKNADELMNALGKALSDTQADIFFREFDRGSFLNFLAGIGSN